MSRIKRWTAALLALLFLFVMAPAAAFAEGDDYILIYAQVPQDWQAPHIWAWADDGTNAFAAWPGEAMEADADNPGWYRCWVPATATNIIINASEGTVQTKDQKIEAKNAWFTIAGPEDVTVSYDQQTEGELPEYVATFKIHAQVPESWQDVGLWAWLDPDGTNAFEAWPGKAMAAGEDGWYTAAAPVWVNRIIVNGNGGEVQTEDLSIDPAEIWVTVAEDGSAEFTYNDPNAPVAEDITVRVKAPADWTGPCLWAWSAPDGTNAFTSWPGEPLEDTGDGWLTLTVPGWVNSLIVNGNEGSVQTGDLSVGPGKDVWVVVTDAENAAVSYEEPADAAPAPDSASAPAAEPQAPAEEPGGMAVGVIVAIAAVVILAAGGVFLAMKKKKQ